MTEAPEREALIADEPMSLADWLHACIAWLDDPSMRASVIEHIEEAAEALQSPAPAGWKEAYEAWFPTSQWPGNCYAGELALEDAFRAGFEASPQPPATAGDGWRDIASAPLGKAVLIWRPSNFGDDNVFVATKEEDGSPDGLWQCEDGKNYYHLRGQYPTHWQPLPAPPPPVLGDGGEEGK